MNRLVVILLLASTCSFVSCVGSSRSAVRNPFASDSCGVLTVVVFNRNWSSQSLSPLDASDLLEMAPYVTGDTISSLKYLLVDRLYRNTGSRESEQDYADAATLILISSPKCGRDTFVIGHNRVLVHAGRYYLPDRAVMEVLIAGMSPSALKYMPYALFWYWNDDELNRGWWPEQQ